MAKDKYFGTRDLVLVEFLSQRGIVWDKWRLESVGRERFWFRNTAALRDAIFHYNQQGQPCAPRPGHATLGDLMKSFTQSAPQTQ